jgi:hypothetical protein
MSQGHFTCSFRQCTCRTKRKAVSGIDAERSLKDAPKSLGCSVIVSNGYKGDSKYGIDAQKDLYIGAHLF